LSIKMVITYMTLVAVYTFIVNYYTKAEG